MRRIIDGKAYDTETGTLLGEAESNAYKNDFRWWKERLYRTPRGAYFLAGEGHAMSSWAARTPDGTGPGSGIRALTEAKAMEWAERYLDAEEYEELWTPEEA